MLTIARNVQKFSISTSSFENRVNSTLKQNGQLELS